MLKFEVSLLLCKTALIVKHYRPIDVNRKYFGKLPFQSKSCNTASWV